MRLSLDIRAQILANAMLLFPQLVQQYIDKHGHRSLQADRTFDVVYGVDNDQSHDGSTDSETDAGLEAGIDATPKHRACLVRRNLKTPALCQILIQTDYDATVDGADGLAKNLMTVVASLLREQSSLLPSISDEETGMINGVRCGWDRVVMMDSEESQGS